MTALTTNPKPDPSPAGSRSRLSTARSALGLLRERAWYGALLGVVVISVVFVFLGRWQYHRHEARSARNHLVNTNYGAAPVALGVLLPTVGQNPAAPLPAGLQWRPVRIDGSYLTGHTVLLRNRPQPSAPDDGTGSTAQNSQNGYEVVVPFRTTSGPILLIDRGWIPAGTSSAARPDSVPSPPAGDVQVIARMHQSEPGMSRQAPSGQANRLDVSSLGAALGAPDAEHVIGGFGLLVSESPAAAGTPTPIGKPDPGLGINLAYAVQWVAFAIAAYVMLGVAMVREVRRRDLAPEGVDPPDQPLRSRYGLAR